MFKNHKKSTTFKYQIPRKGGYGKIILLIYYLTIKVDNQNDFNFMCPTKSEKCNTYKKILAAEKKLTLRLSIAY